MKKLSLIAALLAAAASAHAQSNVTLFGLIDLNMSRYSAGSRSNGAGLTAMNDGHTNGLNGSRWGIRANEDLGGGLKASVVIESGVLADTGNLAQGGRGFGRQVFIGLGTPTLGEVRLGRQYILSDSVVGQGNPFGNALVNNPTTGVTNVGRALPMWLNAPRADNTVQYQTPTFGGVTLAGQWAPGENTTDRFHGVRATYAAGATFAGVAYEWNKARVGGADTNKSLSVTANHNFGPVKVLGGFQRNRDLATGSGNGAAVGVSNLVVTGARSFTMDRLDGYTLAVEVPIGLTTLGANFTRMKYANRAGADATLGKAALAARYALSKNTFLYAGASIATGELKEYIAQERVLQAGLRMAF
jgi:general bacterial porin, GBP family